MQPFYSRLAACRGELIGIHSLGGRVGRCQVVGFSGLPEINIHGLTLCDAGQGKQGDAVGPGVELHNNAEAKENSALSCPCCLLSCKQRLWSRRPHHLDQKDRWAGEDNLNIMEIPPQLAILPTSRCQCI